MRPLAWLTIGRILGILGICCLTIATIAFSAYAVKSTHTAPKETAKWPVLQAVSQQPVAVFLGGAESVASAGHASWPTLVSQARGWQQVNLAHGGTGYTVTGTCGSDKCPDFLQSVPSIVALDPSIVVVAGGWNETADKTDVSVQVAQTFQTLHQGLPEATIVVVGPASPDAQPSQSVLDTNDAVKTAANSLGLKFISLLEPPALNPAMFAGGQLDDAGQAAIASRIVAAMK